MSVGRLYCTRGFWSSYGSRVAPLLGEQVPMFVGDDVDPADIEVAYFSPDLWSGDLEGFARAIRDAANLRWLQTSTAGSDFPLFRATVERGVTVTTASGAAAPTIAHTAMMLVLALSRDLPAWVAAQGRHEWSPHALDDLDGAVLGLVGYGPIGRELARLAAAFGMDVRICRQSAQPADDWPTTNSIGELAPVVDWLVLATPLTRATHHLLSVPVLATMKSTARIVNVGRGALVDEDALVAALAAGRLAGAGLDVFDVEPLPAEHPLWALPNVIVTPHSSGNGPATEARAAEIFLDNLARAGAGAPLVNVVSR